jgi:hypothetical protein
MLHKLDLNLPKNSLSERIIDYFISDRRLRTLLPGYSRRQRIFLKRRLGRILIGFSFSLMLFAMFYLVMNYVRKAGFVGRSSVKLTEEVKNNLSLDQKHEGVLSKETKSEESELTINPLQISPTPLPITTSFPENYQNTSSQITNEEVAQEPSFKIPDHFVPYTGSLRLNLRQGSLKIRFVADWVNEETPIFWGNFSGNSKINLFEIMGNGQMLFFNNYNEAGMPADSLQVELVNDYKGKEFTIEARWDFRTNPGVKELYVDGVLQGHEELSLFTANANPLILIGDIEVLALSDSF